MQCYVRCRFINTNLLNNEEEEDDPRASPMIEKSFAGQPPALILEAECDPLADQSPGNRVFYLVYSL